MISDLPNTNKAYLSAVIMADISQSFYLQDGGKNQLAYIWNKITLLSLYVQAYCVAKVLVFKDAMLYSVNSRFCTGYHNTFFDLTINVFYRCNIGQYVHV